VAKRPQGNSEELCVKGAVVIIGSYEAAQQSIQAPLRDAYQDTV